MANKFISLEQFEQLQEKHGNSSTREGHGKAKLIKDFLTNKENWGKPLQIDNEMLICAKAKKGYTKETTEDQLADIKHAFNAAINTSVKSIYGTKTAYVEKKLVFDKDNGVAYMLITGIKKDDEEVFVINRKPVAEQATPAAQPTPEMPNEATEIKEEVTTEAAAENAAQA